MEASAVCAEHTSYRRARFPGRWRRMRPSRCTCSRTLPLPLSTTPTRASGTSTPSLSTREVSSTGSSPLAKAASSALRSGTGVWCVSAGSSSRRASVYTVSLSSVKTMARSSRCSRRMRHSTSTFALEVRAMRRCSR